ncbi:glutamate cyclase domain-containing protein [Candidatus Margulisiibacteriota bacterium]
MNNLSKKIEDIILLHDKRSISTLQSKLKPGYCLRSAELLLSCDGPIIIGTGFPVANTFESDGPLGAIALYLVLTQVGKKPLFVCASPMSRSLIKKYDTYEIPILSAEESRPVIKKAIQDILPALIITVERAGVAADGNYYNSMKKSITDKTAKFDLFLEYSDAPSICFGDGGNEIGMGNIHQYLSGLDIIPSITKCTELVITSVSNWGVYGVIALMSKLVNQDLFDVFDVWQIIQDLIKDGCIDGVTRKSTKTEDSFELETGMDIIRQLKQTIGLL